MSTGIFYWAQPIDFASSPVEHANGIEEWEYVDKLRSFVTGCGYTVYSPIDAFFVGGPVNPSIGNINATALAEAAAVVAFLPMGVTSYGVPAEIEKAVAMGKPVVIVTDTAESSWTVAWWDNHPNVLVANFGHSHQEIINWVADWHAEHEGDDVRALIFQKHDERAILPARGHSDDAGYDLYTLEDTYIPAGEFADVPTGVAVDLPDGLWGMITGRSSTLRKRKLLVATGIIDTGYTGVLFAGCQNLSGKPVMVAAGERVAQMILLPTSALGYNAAWGKTRTKERGANGFGSTGR